MYISEWICERVVWVAVPQVAEQFCARRAEPFCCCASAYFEDK